MYQQKIEFESKTDHVEKWVNINDNLDGTMAICNAKIFLRGPPLFYSRREFWWALVKQQPLDFRYLLWSSDQVEEMGLQYHWPTWHAVDADVWWRRIYGGRLSHGPSPVLAYSAQPPMWTPHLFLFSKFFSIISISIFECCIYFILVIKFMFKKFVINS